MKLSEIKSALVTQFFKDREKGAGQDDLQRILESLSKTFDADLVSLLEDEDDSLIGCSSEPSKAFKKFTDGRRAILTINEDEDLHTTAIFVAIRVGTEIMYSNLTTELREEQKGNLSIIKHALKQAKNLNDEVYFKIQTDE